MRVIAGRERGRRLRVPGGRGVRPALARLKASLFDILTSRGLVVGEEILDLFAGSGSLGIEALSRGARSVVFVEQDRVVGRVLWRNVAGARLTAQAELLIDSAPRALSRLNRRRRQVDGVFVDPPYGTSWAERTLAVLGRTTLVRDGGWVVVHHRRGERTPDVSGGLAVVLRRRVGGAELALYRNDTSMRVGSHDVPLGSEAE